MTNIKSYYDFTPILSRNAVVNMVIGARGLGKTYGAKLRAIKRAIKRGEQFIYLRRYSTELDSRHTFFADIDRHNEFPDYDFQVMGLEAQYAPKETRNDKKRVWKTIGYFIALSTAQKLKSKSYPKVTLIIFDEFILERGALHYLPNEVAAFLNLYSTVDRWEDRVRVLMLANSVSIMAPYFNAWDIQPDMNEDGSESISEWRAFGKGFGVAHFPEAAQFKAEAERTRFGRFISNTAFGEFALQNQFSDNSSSLVSRKSKNAKYVGTIETQNGDKFSVWKDVIGFSVQAKLPKSEVRYTLNPASMDEDTTLLNKQSPLLRVLKSSYSHGSMLFDKPYTRNAFVRAIV